MVAETLPRELRRYRAWALANAIPDGVRSPAFLHLVQRIERAVVHHAPTATLLVDGAVAFDAVLAGIGEAREEILLETYIMRDDRIGTAVQHALIAAVARGVSVRVLVDAIGSLGTDESFWTTLEQHGVQVRHFHRFWRLPFDALRRDHRKIIVIDRIAAFTGGMNIGEEYGSSIRSSGRAWRDTFLRVEGSVAQELAAVFAEGWDRADGPPLPGLEYISWSEGITVPRLTSMRAFSARGIQARFKRGVGLRRDRRRGRRVKPVVLPSDGSGPSPGAMQPTETSGVVVVLDSRPGRGQRETRAVLAALVGGARQRLWITTPYFAPPIPALGLLRRAARRGVDVRLLVPGPLADVPLVRHAAHGTYASLLSSGVRVFEYEPATLHAKTVVIDSHVGLVGSSNLDFRSLWLNAECNLLIFDDAGARDLDVAFLQDLEASTEILAVIWARRTIGHRLVDAVSRALRWAL